MTHSTKTKYPNINNRKILIRFRAGILNRFYLQFALHKGDSIFNDNAERNNEIFKLDFLKLILFLNRKYLRETSE